MRVRNTHTHKSVLRALWLFWWHWWQWWNLLVIHVFLQGQQELQKDGKKYTLIEDYSIQNARKNYSSDISCTNSSNVRPKAVAIAVTVRSDGLLRSRSNKLI